VERQALFPVPASGALGGWAAAAARRRGLGEGRGVGDEGVRWVREGRERERGSLVPPCRHGESARSRGAKHHLLTIPSFVLLGAEISD
jgi:hypothetical protein